jgi:hypothetical protein
LKWRWLYLIKNRRGQYLGGMGANKNKKANYKWVNKVGMARIFSRECHANACVKIVQRKFDHTAYVAKGRFEISECA